MKQATNTAFYWFGNILVRVVALAVAHWRVHGRENVPRRGACIVVSNHLSYADPPLIALAVLHRRIRFMAKMEIFAMPLGVVPRAYGAFPVRRFGADLGALFHAERLLRDGHAVGMFPEGTRGAPGQVRSMHHGAAILALRTGAPILPCAIAGTDQLRTARGFFRRPRISVAIGEAIPVEAVAAPGRADLDALTARVHRAVSELYAETTGSSIPVTTASGAAP